MGRVIFISSVISDGPQNLIWLLTGTGQTEKKSQFLHLLMFPAHGKRWPHVTWGSVVFSAFLKRRICHVFCPAWGSHSGTQFLFECGQATEIWWCADSSSAVWPKYFLHWEGKNKMHSQHLSFPAETGIQRVFLPCPVKMSFTKLNQLKEWKILYLPITFLYFFFISLASLG